MRNTGPATFGARLVSRTPDQDEAAWFFNVPPAPPCDAESVQPGADDTAGLIQIGPLDT